MKSHHFTLGLFNSLTTFFISANKWHFPPIFPFWPLGRHHQWLKKRTKTIHSSVVEETDKDTKPIVFISFLDSLSIKSTLDKGSIMWFVFSWSQLTENKANSCCSELIRWRWISSSSICRLHSSSSFINLWPLSIFVLQWQRKKRKPLVSKMVAREGK